MRLVSILLLAIPLTAGAQVYRCGNTYQSEPCGRLVIPANRPASAPEPTGDVRALCLEKLNDTLIDPGSAQVTNWGLVVTRGGVRSVSFKVNAKNSLGGYAGGRYMVCQVQDGRVTYLQ